MNEKKVPNENEIFCTQVKHPRNLKQKTLFFFYIINCEMASTDSFDLGFIKRPLLDIPGATHFENGVELKIMSYNVRNLSNLLASPTVYPASNA